MVVVVVVGGRSGGLEWLLFLGLMGLMGFSVTISAGYPTVGGSADQPPILSGASYQHHHRDHHRDHRMLRRIERLMGSTATVPSASPPPLISSPPSITTSSRIYHLTDYGADPTGKSDSIDAITKAISDAFRPPSSSDRNLMPGIVDLGGAELHLDGGTYLISRPFKLPDTGGGNLKIHGGSLRASDDFPTDRYLIELWTSSSASYDYEFITLRDLLLDSNFRGGGIAVVDSLRTTVDNCYITHFTSNGIWVKDGHETFITNSYLGQHITAGGDPGERNFSGVAINLMGNDNAVTNVVIFSASIGILVSGQANTLTGVHCYNKATGFGGTGIYLKLPGLTQTRIVNCYMDYTGIVSEDPMQLHISSSFFLGDANVVLKSINGVMRGVDIVDNMFSGSGGGGVDIVRLDQSNGKFTKMDQVTVDRNNVNGGMALRSTVAKDSVEGNGAAVWTVDFSSVLLFPNRIDHVQYTLVLAYSGFPNHALRNVSGNRVTIESDVPVTAIAHVWVDQSGSTTTVG